jgi:type IV pilus assembly protein PilE
MSNPTRARGFSLIEIMLVLAVLGILSAIAIPSFMGQRHRARVIGDAMANAKVLQMGLESLKSDTGSYGAAGIYQWNALFNAADTGYALVPTFQPSGNSKVNYQVTVAAGGLTYVLNVNDPTMAGTPLVYSTNQLGQTLFRWY